jgi:hypothetical protein
MRISLALFSIIACSFSLVGCGAWGSSDPNGASPDPSDAGPSPGSQGAGDAGSASPDASGNASSSGNGGAATPPDAPDRHAPSLAALAMLLDESEALPSADAIVAAAVKLPDVHGAISVRNGDAVELTFDDGIPATILLDGRATSTANATGTTNAKSAAPKPVPHAPGIMDPLPAAVPEAKTAVVFNALGDLFHDGSADLASIFSHASYKVKLGKGTIEDLKDPSTFADTAVFYMSSHGDSVALANVETGKPPPPQGYGLWTGTCKTDRIPALYTGDVDATPKRLAYFLARNTNPGAPSDCIYGKRGSEWHYVATEAFFDKYVSFKAKDSLVWLDTCHSDNTFAQSFKQTVFKKNAAAYAGWSYKSDDVAWVVAPYVFDRATGANVFDGGGNAKYGPEHPKQRPFSWHGIVDDMKSRGLDVSPYSGAHLNAYWSDAVSGDEVAFGYLAPSITTALIAEDVKLMLVPMVGGDAFGANASPSDVRVTLGGFELPIGKVDGFDLAEITLPDDAPTSGDLALFVNGHESNHVRISEWRGVMHVTQTSGDNGALVDEFTVNMHFRFAAQSTRDRPHDAPHAVPIGMAALPDTTVAYKGSGSWPVANGTCTRTNNITTDAQPLTAFQGSIGAVTMQDGTQGSLRLHLWSTNGARHDCPDGSFLESAGAVIEDDVPVSFSVDPDTLAISAPIVVTTGSDATETISVRFDGFQAVVGANDDNAR